MASKTKTKAQKRIQRHRRIRGRIYGTQQRPRLFVFKSNQHIYASLIDDVNSATILFVSDQSIKSKKSDVDAAGKVGEKIGNDAIKEGYKRVVFDRGGYPYHGKVKAVAEGARSRGLKF